MTLFPPADNTVHYFVILIRNGPQVILTQMLSTHDAMMRGSLDFPNLIKIHGISSSFHLSLEIYSMVGNPLRGWRMSVMFERFYVALYIPIHIQIKKADHYLHLQLIILHGYISFCSQCHER